MTILVKSSFNWVGAELSAAETSAVLAATYTVKLLHSSFNKIRIIGEDTSLKVAAVAGLHAYAGTCHIGRTNVDAMEVEYQHLEVNPGTEHPLKTGL